MTGNWGGVLRQPRLMRCGIIMHYFVLSTFIRVSSNFKEKASRIKLHAFKKENIVLVNAYARKTIFFQRLYTVSPLLQQ